MFADRLDALMSIAEVSNSQLGRSVNLNPSYIGRLRNGARPLPKSHDYLPAMCRYLAERITKDYQTTALRNLTGIGGSALADPADTARYLEQWLAGQEQSASEAAGIFLSGLSRYAPTAPSLAGNPTQTQAQAQTRAQSQEQAQAQEQAQEQALAETQAQAHDTPQKYAEYLFGNAGKRKAVEQFFHAILQEDKPQTLLLFSDENMAWLYEDTAFATRWAELFSRVIEKGNRVRIIHTVSRDLNEMLEALTKWIPLYMTGMIEPYRYPRLRDGVYQRTLFIAPRTAAVVSSSVQQDTDGMLNMFITNRTALAALEEEYERYFALCRPLMRIFPEKDARELQETVENLMAAPGDSHLCCTMPPLFAMPEALAREMAESTGDGQLLEQWQRSLSLFERSISEQRLSVTILDPDYAQPCGATQGDSPYAPPSCDSAAYTTEHYLRHARNLKLMEQQYRNLTVHYARELERRAVLYLKEDAGVVVSKADAPRTAFVITDRNMMSAFHDYLEKRLFSR